MKFIADYPGTFFDGEFEIVGSSIGPATPVRIHLQDTLGRVARYPVWKIELYPEKFNMSYQDALDICYAFHENDKEQLIFYKLKYA